MHNEALAKVWKETIVFVMSIRPSFSQVVQLGSKIDGFSRNFIFEDFFNLSRKLKFRENLARINGGTLHEADRYTFFYHLSLISS
jgi:hypothetical protein